MFFYSYFCQHVSRRIEKDRQGVHDQANFIRLKQADTP